MIASLADAIIVVDEQADRIYKLELELKLAKHHIAELLKAGTHDGPCDYEEIPNGSCIKHIKTFEARRDKAKRFMGLN